jgi:hypothetical protein
MTAHFKMMIDYTTKPWEIVAQIEVTDTTVGQVIASKQITRGDFPGPYNYQDLALPFDWSSRAGHMVEFRVWSYNITYMNVASVDVYEQTFTFFCPGSLAVNSANAHSTGSSCISNGSASDGNLVYGPYVSDFPGLPSLATFSLRFSNVTATGGTAVGAIDVHAYNPNSNIDMVLAQATITASQINSSGYQIFSLLYDPTFYIANGYLIETRVFGWGRGQIETQWTQITPE